jgi:uncharacterized protein (TIGR03437 family)
MTRTLLTAFAILAPSVFCQTVTDFFDDTVLHEVRVTIAPSDWKLLHDQYMDDTYYRCEFEWRGLHLNNVGVRSRGSGTRNSIKPNLGFDFSRYDSKQRFLTLKSVVTRNFAQDPSLVREYLSIKMFARMGLPYLREAFARIVVNGEYAGLFLLVEPIDKRFLLSRFGEDTGYLYEGNFVENGYRFEYLGEDPAAYLPAIFEPKTHEDEPDAARLIAMIRTANQAPDAEFVSALNAYLDLDQFVAHLAVEQFLAEHDGLLGYGGMVNYYLYRRMSDNRFTVLVWDKDNTFIGDSAYSVWTNSQENVLARRALADPALRQRFLQTLMHAAEIAGGERGWLATERERIHALIRTAAMSDPVSVCLGDQGLQRCVGTEFDAHHRYLASFFGDRLNFVLGEILAAGLVTDPEAPVLRSGAAANLAATQTALTPGSLARISMRSRLTGTTWAGRVPLAKELADFKLLLAGTPLPLVMVSSTEVLFQVPWEVHYGAQRLQAIWQGHADHTINVEIRPALPAVVALTHANWVPVTEAAPVRANEILILFVTGLGLPSIKQETGNPSPVDRLVPLLQTVTASVGGVPAKALFSGLAPGLIGVAQVILEMPGELPAGNRLPLLLIADGEPGTSYTVDVTR